MKQTPEQLLKQLNKVKLSSSEKASIKLSLMDGINAPVPTQTASPFSWFLAKPFTVSAFIILFAFSGVALGAEGSLPGDTLYKFKRDITEPLVSGILPTDDLRLSWEIKKTERRIEEARGLSNRGDLSSERIAEIKAGIASNISKIENKLAAISEKTDSRAPTLRVSEKLSAITKNNTPAGNEEIALRSTKSLEESNVEEIVLAVEEGRQRITRNIVAFEKTDSEDSSVTSISALSSVADEAGPVNIYNKPETRSTIQIEMPKAGEIISSPVSISGEAVGNWYFEGEFSVEIVDSKGKVLTKSYVTATEDAYTTDFVPFKRDVSFEEPSSGAGFVKLQSFSQKDGSLVREVQIPVTFKVGEEPEDFENENNVDESSKTDDVGEVSQEREIEIIPN